MKRRRRTTRNRGHYTRPGHAKFQYKRSETIKGKKTTYYGIEFASKSEADRYLELRDMQNHGDISELEYEPKYRIVVNGKFICNFYPDFRYKNKNGDTVVEDVKAPASKYPKSYQIYRMKCKLLEATEGVKVNTIKM